MDALVLIGSFTVLCLIGMPVAYALGLAAIFAALWMGIPLEAIALKTSDGMDDFPLLAIPFFILAGAIMGEGGMASRIIDLAKVFVGFIRGGLALVNIVASTMFGCISGSSVADTASIGSVMIPEMVTRRLSAAVRGQRDDLGLAAAAADPAVAQHGDLFAGRRRHRVGGAPVHRRRDPGPAARRVADGAGADLRLSQQPAEGRGDPARAGALDRARFGLGPRHRLHHHGRHPVRHLHADRKRGGRLRLGVLRHHVHLPQLQVERAAASDRPRHAHRRHGDDHDRLLGGVRLHDGA